MAKLTKEDFISALKEMTILEVKELVDAMKEEFGVDPSAVAVAAAPAGPPNRPGSRPQWAPGRFSPARASPPSSGRRKNPAART